MIKPSRHGASLGALILFGLLACDRLHGPIIYNSLSSTVTVKVDWEDGRSDRVRLHAGELIHAGIEDYGVQKIEVSMPGEVIQVLSSDDLARLARTHDTRSAGFVIERMGIRAMSEYELEEAIAEHRN